MRTIRVSVAVMAAAVMLSTLASPAMAAGKKGGGDSFFDNLGSIFDFGGDNRRGGSNGYNPPKPNHQFGGGDGYGKGKGKGKGKGGGHHGGPFDVTFWDNPGTPRTSGTNTIVYFGTCLNQAGVQQAGNAGDDGYCLPFESLVGSEGNPGSGPTCTITKTKKSHGGGTPSFARGSKGGSYGGSTTSETETVNGTCADYQAANPPKKGHEHEHDEEHSED